MRQTVDMKWGSGRDAAFLSWAVTNLMILLKWLY